MLHLKPGVGVWVCVGVVAVFTTTAYSQSNIIPPIPDSLTSTSLFYLWNHALSEQEKSGVQVLRGNDVAPKTFIAPEYGEVTNWVPQDSPHPLYDSHYFNLLREILLDYMVDEEVKPDDPRMSQPNGLQVTNLNGKTLTFKRDYGIITVNGKIVTKSSTKRDGITFYVVNTSLFDHREIIHKVWSEYIKTVPHYDPFGNPL